MAKILNVAAVNGMVIERGEESPREAMIQFEEAVKRLDGTGVDLVVTCETMMMNQPAGTGEDPENPGELLSAYSDFAAATAVSLPELHVPSSTVSRASRYSTTDTMANCSVCITRCSRLRRR